jgi:hypothetical protein
MVIALSRPAAPDDFALTNEPPSKIRVDPRIEPHEAIDVTQAEIKAQPRPSLAESPAPRRATAAQDAATLAADEQGSDRRADGSELSVQDTAAVSQILPERTARFTTIEEEEARIHSHNQRSWFIVAAQLAALVAILAGMGAFAVHLSRPPSADELYAKISDRDDSEDGASLVNVENEIDHFLELYQNDPRALELRRFKQRIDLEKTERKLWRKARDADSDNDPALLPAEQLYLRAADLAERSPEQATALLQSLVDLYRPQTGGKSDADVTAVVQLAEQRLLALRADLTRRHDRELKALNERLAVAEQLSGTDPQQAAAMYNAIITLHRNNAFAKDVVAQAQARLQELNQQPQ